MADRVSASITIGGVVSCDQYRALCALILDEALCIEWDGDPFTPDARVEGEPFSLYAQQILAHSKSPAKMATPAKSSR